MRAWRTIAASRYTGPFVTHPERPGSHGTQPPPFAGLYVPGLFIVFQLAENRSNMKMPSRFENQPLSGSMG